jgi:hypothetical protein
VTVHGQEIDARDTRHGACLYAGTISYLLRRHRQQEIGCDLISSVSILFLVGGVNAQALLLLPASCQKISIKTKSPEVTDDVFRRLTWRSRTSVISPLLTRRQPHSSDWRVEKCHRLFHAASVKRLKAFWRTLFGLPQAVRLSGFVREWQSLAYGRVFNLIKNAWRLIAGQSQVAQKHADVSLISLPVGWQSNSVFLLKQTLRQRNYQISGVTLLT